MGHVRLIYLISLHSMTPLMSNHSITLHSENTMAGDLQEGVYVVSTRCRVNRVTRSLSTLVFCEDRVVQLIKRSELFLVNEVELPKISQATSRIISTTNLVHKQEEVSVTRVEMRWWIGQLRAHLLPYDLHTLNAKGTNLIEVVAVQVSVHAEESPEDRPDGIPKVLWEGGA